jgi:hypothetical protein
MNWRRIVGIVGSRVFTFALVVLLFSIVFLVMIWEFVYANKP